MTSLEGQLSVQLELMHGQVRAVRVHSTRPPNFSALLAGRSASEVARLIPSLFSVCRVAQGAAAFEALGLAGRPEQFLALALETLEHHAWHFDVEWPRALGLEPRASDLRATLQVLRGCPREQIIEHFRAKLGALMQPDALGSVFVARCAQLDSGLRWPTPHIGHPTLADCEAGLAAEAQFAARPTLKGRPVEVGSLARVFHHAQVQTWGRELGWGLETRARARLLDANQAVDALEAQSMRSPEVVEVCAGVRAALVEVVRGPLVHRVECQSSRVVTWRSVAPTEWSFHPDGALQSLVGLVAPAVQDTARLLVALLDPCVGCTIEVLEVAHA